LQRYGSNLCDSIGMSDFDDPWRQPSGQPVLKLRWTAGVNICRMLYLLEADRNLTALPEGPTSDLAMFLKNFDCI
jgi:hypothetical protein